MRNFQLSALMLIVALTFFQQHAQAQIKSENAQTKNTELREKAFTALESLAGELNTLQSAENRARIGANIADSLWKHDETKARALFQLVQDDIKSHLTIPENLRDAKEMQTLLVFLKLRSDTLDRIVQHDPELAFSFFKATEVDLDKLPHYLIDEQRHLDLRLSQKLAADNPEVALRLARMALARGFSYGLLETLAQLDRKHKEQASILYKEIVQKLRDTDIKADWQARQFAETLVSRFQPPAIDESAFKDFVAVFVAAAAANGCDAKSAEDDQNDFCQWVRSIRLYVEQFNSRVPKKKQRTPSGDEYDAARIVEAQAALETVSGEGTIDDVLVLAEKYPDVADAIYWRALQMARGAGELERMRKIAEEYKGSPEGREQMLLEVARAERAAKFDEEQMAELQKQLNETPRIEERIMLLMAAAYRAGAGNRKMALRLINRAEQIVETMRPGKEQSTNQIGVAILYCLENDERGFAIMEAVVPKLNSLVDAAVKLDGYDTSYLRDGEWNMSAGGQIGELLTQLAEGAQFFAWSDFDRAMNLAAQFERPEIRMMAQLKLAQGVLAGPHKRNFGY